MDSHTLIVLEFNLIVDELVSFCRSEEGKALLARQPFTTDREELEGRLIQAGDLRRLLQSEEKEPYLQFPAVEALFPVVEKEGAVLEQEELLSLALFLESSLSLEKYVTRWIENNPASPLESFFPFPRVHGIIDEIYFFFERDGKVKEKNVPELKTIGRSISKLKQEIGVLVQNYLKNSDFRDYFQTDVPAQRSSRTVLPLKAQYKHKIKGIVHEVSATGATLFIEPYEIVDKNNLLAEEENQYRAVVHRILRELSSQVRNALADICLVVDRTAELDTLYARARYSITHACTAALFVERGLQLRQARHPLLGRECVPIDLEMDSSINVLIISGPNTGGKTVTLKTAGLLALMNQFGMEIPAGEGTEMAVFSDVFVDIGDEQSIQESLSTFSAHLARLSDFTRKAAQSSLLLLDELGAGTDAEEGCALAMALLDHFVERDCTVLTTTHQNLLKNYAATRETAENASVDFDAETLQPTYRLNVGFPGESHAIDIAVNSGLDARVVDAASNYLHSGRTDVSELIKTLNAKNRELSEKESELNRRMAELATQIATAEEERKSLSVQAIGLKKEGIRDLNALLSESRKTLENLVKQVKETAASPQTRKEVKTFLDSMSESVSSKSEELEQEEEQLREQPDAPVTEGAQVKIRSTGKLGRVVRKGKAGFWVVNTGSVKISMREDDLLLVTGGTEKEFKIDTAGIVPTSKALFELDLRGSRLDEAITTLEKQIDSCLISGLYEFSIIHGHGEGVLQRGVHQFLSASRQVSDYHFAHPEQGGFGKTDVVLRRA